MFSKLFFLLFCLVANYDTAFAETLELDWWQTSVIYQIYPKSFKDSNGDGVGDLKGIEQQVPYFKESGIDVIWLSPIFQSPMLDAGYDISNFKEIDPIFGTMEDFDSLLKTLQAMNMKLVLDFVPNHSSNKCDWFQKSIDKVEPYTNYYVWEDPKNLVNNTSPQPPNNWISVFQGSAWEYNEKRKQFYLHEFLIEQPDLNYREPKVVEEMKGILSFWLEKGVDGFRVDSIMYLYEDSQFRDEPTISNDSIDGGLKYTSLNHTYTIDQPETYNMLAEFRELLDSYKKKDNKTRVLMTEAYTTLKNTIRYYGNDTIPMAQIPFNFQLLTRLNYSSNASAFESVINSWIDNMPQGRWANWVLGNHDNPRITSRFDPESVDAINMLLLLLPGTGIIYNGDELGMLDTKVRWDQTNDVSAKKLGEAFYAEVSRDPERTPMQWNSSTHAGFSNTTNTTWLPVNPNYYSLNYENQKLQERSHWNVFRNLTQLRKTEAFQSGEFKTYTFTDWVFGFERNTSDEMYVVLLNLNNEEEIVNLQAKMSNLTASNLDAVLVSVNSEHEIGDSLTTGQAVDGNQTNTTSNSPKIGFSMRPNSAVVLRASLKSGDSAGQGSGAYSVLCSSSTAVISVTMATVYLLNFFKVISH